MSANDKSQNVGYYNTDIQDPQHSQNVQSLSTSPNFLRSSSNCSLKIFSITKIKKQNLDSSSETSNLNPNSLISITKEVFRYLEKMKVSNSINVTNHILQRLNISQWNVSFKNIQRRVYDVINVMDAIGIIGKDKNSLKYRGHHKFKASIHKLGLQQRNSVLRDKLNYQSGQVFAKQNELISICLKVLLELFSTT
jgi:hypothetical protein